MKINKDDNYKEDKKEYSKFIIDACDEISNLTEEQYENERKFFTSFDEELENLAKNLSKKIKKGEIEDDVNE